jgi:endonuclease/exonuclease/phosphatase family metal-dependent hydrolase
MTYNILHGRASSLSAVAQVITSQSPDVVGLQEVDERTNRSNQVSQAAELGRLTGMHAMFVASLESYDGGQYGLAALSRYPIVRATRYPLRSIDEQRVLALFEVQIDGSRVLPFAVTHLSFVTAAERHDQALDIRTQLEGQPLALLVGDLNESPSTSDAGAYGVLEAFMDDAWPLGGSGPAETSPADVPRYRIDYVMLGAAWPHAVQAMVVNAATQSDHRPVVAALTLP